MENFADSAIADSASTKTTLSVSKQRPNIYANGIRGFLLMGGIQFCSYLNLTFNFRAIAESQRGFAMLTDAIAVLLAYFIIRKVSRDEHCGWTLAGMVLGGSLAAWVGITMTEQWRTP